MPFPGSLGLSTTLLQPLLALPLWTFVMELWLYATRMPIITSSKTPLTGQMTYAELNAKIPRHVQWKAENYNHLHEQPTLFYAIMLVLAVCGVDDPTTVRMAWGYVGLRVGHSLVQATVNVLPVRFALFASSSVVLLGLWGRAATVVFA